MPIKYKINVLDALKKAGYSTYRLRKEKILAESTMQKFRDGEIVTADNLALVCSLLNCQPGDILEYVPDSSGGTDEAED
ncbi:MAG: helix-turn-helix domain-containing protein [Oscillospiraceae bacterium]